MTHHHTRYFVAPDQKGSADGFAVVREAMAEGGKVAIGEVAFGGRDLLAIAPPANKKNRGMMAYTLRCAEELRKAADYFAGIPAPAIDKKQHALANELIKAQPAPFQLDEYKDDYEAALRELIEAKRSKAPFPVAEEQPKPKVVSHHGCTQAERD